jgi:plastocyanin domain-containing protein
MTGIEWLVLLGGAAAIVWVNWYFFLAQRGTATAIATAGTVSGAGAATGAPPVPQVTITVKGGYDPATVRVRAGAPVRLVFDRQETSGCSEEIVLPDFGIRRFLPAFQQTTIEVTPPAPGRYEFTCGMSMLRGVLVAED